MRVHLAGNDGRLCNPDGWKKTGDIAVKIHKAGGFTTAYQGAFMKIMMANHLGHGYDKAIKDVAMKGETMQQHLAGRYASRAEEKTVREHLVAVERAFGIDTVDPADISEILREMTANHPYRLSSYFYLKDSNDAVVVAYLNSVARDPKNLIIDSGLFSLMFGSEKGTLPETYEAYEDYTKQYLATVDRWGVPFTFVESDTHRLLGMEATHKLRKLFEPYGDRVIYVWHQPEGLEGLEKLALEKDYIALSIPELRMLASGNGKVQGQSNKVKRMTNDLLRRIHSVCKRNGVLPPRIHLLGCTVTDMMETTLAYSCDSTSWLSGPRFGNGYCWVSGAARPLQTAHIRSKRFQHWKERCAEKYPLAAKVAEESSVGTEYMLVCLACAAAYAEYQTWLDSRYTHTPMRGA